MLVKRNVLNFLMQIVETETKLFHMLAFYAREIQNQLNFNLGPIYRNPVERR